VIATGIGIIVGLSTALFLKLLDWSLAYSTGYPYYFLLLPVGLLISALAIKYLEPDAKGYGIEKVIAAVHKRGDKIYASIVLVKLATTILTISTERIGRSDRTMWADRRRAFFRCCRSLQIR